MAKTPNFLTHYYSIGVQWAMAHFTDLLQFQFDKSTFEMYARNSLEESGLAETLPVRIYGFYIKNPQAAQEQFVAGAWDTINGRTGLGEQFTPADH